MKQTHALNKLIRLKDTGVNKTGRRGLKNHLGVKQTGLGVKKGAAGRRETFLAACRGCILVQRDLWSISPLVPSCPSFLGRLLKLGVCFWEGNRSSHAFLGAGSTSGAPAFLHLCRPCVRAFHLFEATISVGSAPLWNLQGSWSHETTATYPPSASLHTSTVKTLPQSPDRRQVYAGPIMAPANERTVPAPQIIYRIALGNAVPQLQRGALGCHGPWEFGTCSWCNYIPSIMVYTEAKWGRCVYLKCTHDHTVLRTKMDINPTICCTVHISIINLFTQMQVRVNVPGCWWERPDHWLAWGEALCSTFTSAQSSHVQLPGRQRHSESTAGLPRASGGWQNQDQREPSQKYILRDL